MVDGKVDGLLLGHRKLLLPFVSYVGGRGGTWDLRGDVQPTSE